jgi:hypothetical protein
MNENLFKMLIKEASLRISVNLPEKDSTTVAVEFERLLREVMGKTYMRSSPKVDEIALRIGEKL